MSIDLKPELQRFIDEQVNAGRYDSPQEVVEAALAIMEQQNRQSDLAPGELDAILAEGLADIEAGDVHDGDAVFRELDELSTARRQERAQ